ncbi:Chaperone protein DnaJ [Nosema granulosis]|uniref:Chaperone protein DnaJ n=1 Tax=Nosema granulosis TaxID=83296 RepID=A0A9P6KYZ1_9MICR|nr:Chaperone protein DnaJ [Nosema granulosis]
MSLHFFLKLRYDASQDEVERAYKKYLIKHHPDKSKSDTLDLYLNIKQEYEKYKKNQTDENFYICCFPSEIEQIRCRCGSKFDEENIFANKIECECCSCYIIVENEPYKLKKQ